MTYDTLEASRDSGAPVELFVFTMGATVWRFTSADRVYTVATGPAAGTYQPTAGLARSAVDYNQEDGSQALTIRLPRVNEVAAMFIGLPPVARVFVTAFRFHRDAATDIIQACAGEVAAARFEGAEAILICLPASGALARRIPRTMFQRQCNWALYSTGCGVNKATFKTTAILSAVTGNTITSATFDAQPDGWFRSGWVELASGERRFVVDHTGAVLTLTHPFAVLAPGASVDAYAGCDHNEATCASKFSNLNRHLGFPRIPMRNPYRGGIV